MAKKTVASLQKGEGRTYSKVIKMEKSPKTGAYVFKEEMVPNDAVQAALKYFICFHSFRYIFRTRSFSASRPALFIIYVISTDIFI